MRSPKDAVHSILDQGGHIVLANPDKSCTVPGWPDRPSSHDDVERWHDLFGLVPASLSASVVDCDFGHPILPRPAARIVTPGGGFHGFYGRTMDLGKRPWLHGDLIGSRGYVILYDPEMVVDAIPLLPSYPFPDLDLFQAAGLPREASRRRIPLELVEVGERHTALLAHLVHAARGGVALDALKENRRFPDPLPDREAERIGAWVGRKVSVDYRSKDPEVQRRRNRKSQQVRKAAAKCKALEAAQMQTRGMKVGAIAEALQIPKRTVYRLLATLPE